MNILCNLGRDDLKYRLISIPVIIKGSKNK